METTINLGLVLPSETDLPYESVRTFRGDLGIIDEAVGNDRQAISLLQDRTGSLEGRVGALEDAPSPAVLSSSAGTRQADIAANTDFTVPLYRTGVDSLLVYLDGILCLKGESYNETGTAGSQSTAIQFLQTIPTTMDVLVRVN